MAKTTPIPTITLLEAGGESTTLLEFKTIRLSIEASSARVLLMYDPNKEGTDGDYEFLASPNPPLTLFDGESEETEVKKILKYLSKKPIYLTGLGEFYQACEIVTDKGKFLVLVPTDPGSPISDICVASVIRPGDIQIGHDLYEID